MIVVSNTSPLTNLAAIGQFDLLHRLYAEISIAEGVWSELNAFGKRWPGSSEVESASWIKRFRIKDRALVTALERDLDSGEAESIALALELSADLILLDEKEGRRAAQRFGLKTLGTVGVLLAAKAKQEIEQIQAPLEKLRKVAGFYLDDELYLRILSLAGENHLK